MSSASGRVRCPTRNGEESGAFPLENHNRSSRSLIAILTSRHVTPLKVRLSGYSAAGQPNACLSNWPWLLAMTGKVKVELDFLLSLPVCPRLTTSNVHNNKTWHKHKWTVNCSAICFAHMGLFLFDSGVGAATVLCNCNRLAPCVSSWSITAALSVRMGILGTTDSPRRSWLASHRY